jgi:hypothetical protein
LTPNHVKGIGVENEEHALFLGGFEGNTRKRLHVLLPTKPWSDDKDMQAGEQSGELGA